MGLMAIGDIHGCAQTLCALLDELAPSATDSLVFVGDYVDRGPDSNGVIECLTGLAGRVRCVFLRGNHESMMLDFLDRGLSIPWRMNGGSQTLESYRTRSGQVEIPDRHIAFLRATKLYHEEPSFFFVHAGLRADLTVRENVVREDEDTLLWRRDHLRARSLAWEKTVVCGHTPHAEPLDEENRILIDTGCVFHGRLGLGRLTAVRLPEREFVSVPYQE